MTALWAVVPSRSAEDAVRAAKPAEGRCGVVVTQALLAGPGAAVVAPLAALAPVLVMAGLHGDADDAATAAGRYVEYGATLVTLQASAGPELMERVVARVGSDHTLALTLWPGIDDAVAAATRLGTSRGKVVSRLASAAAASGVGAVLCAAGDLGVIHQVAPGLGRVVWDVATPGAAGDAARRGASGVILPGTVLASRDPSGALDEFVRAGDRAG